VGGSSWAQAINNLGQVVGGADSRPAPVDTTGVFFPSAIHAWLWDQGMTDLGTNGGVASEALDINNNGEVVGYTVDASYVSHAMLWSPAKEKKPKKTKPPK
jgi:probable HAF family extracellular repeat protein